VVVRAGSYRQGFFSAELTERPIEGARLSALLDREKTSPAGFFLLACSGGRSPATGCAALYTWKVKDRAMLP
jgi:hypothetical protein